MARIFYSLAGEGRGHATRVRAIVDQLRLDHQFVLFAPADAYELLSEAYADTDVRVIRIPGLMFHYTNQRMNYLRTISDGLTYLWRLEPLVRDLELMIRDERPDLVITDFEPSLPRAAQRCHVPYLSIDHQHFLVDYDLSSLPWRLQMSARAMSTVVQQFYHRQVQTVISSFYFPEIRHRDRHVIQTGVLLRPAVLDASPERAGHVLVYLRRFASAPMLDALKRCGRDVLIYGLGSRPSDGRLRFRPVDEHSFVEDLIACDALISNAGNQLMGEAIHLGKPILAMPEAKNFEQQINAHFLRSEGGGEWVTADQFGSDVLRSFLARGKEQSLAINRHRMDGMPRVLAAIRRNLPVSQGVEILESQLQKVA